MQKPFLIIVLISAFLISNHLCEAQFTKEQLRTLPVEIGDAKLVGQDLYVASAEGLYHTKIDNIDFKRISNYTIGKLNHVGDKLFFAASTGSSPDPSYCNGDVIQYYATSTAQSVENGSFQIHNSLNYTHYGLSITGLANRGLIVTENGTIYSTIYITNPYNNFVGNAKIFDQDGNSLGSTWTNFDDITNDEQYYYALKGDQIYRSELPSIASPEIVDLAFTPNFSNRIFHANGQVFITGNSYLFSDDQGLNWSSFDNPHEGLVFDVFEDGLYYFTGESKKIRVSTESFFSTEYDTIYNVINEPLLDGKTFIPLNNDIFLATGKTILPRYDNYIYASFDQGQTWKELFSGLWHSTILKPAITDQARFFQTEGRLYRTFDEGISYEEITPNFISLSITDQENISSLDLTGHHDVLFCDIRFEDGTHKLYRSTDQGENFGAVTNFDLADFFNGDDNVFAILGGDFFMSSDDGESWATLSISEIENNYNSISDIQQESSTILVEHSNNEYYISYDAGANFSSIQVPDNASYKISLENGNIFGIGSRGSTWLKSSEESDWVNTGEEASFFNTDSVQSSNSASKIYTNGGTTIYSRFSKCGFIPELCQSTCLNNKLYASDDFGQTWRPEVTSGNLTFTHNEDHYRYNPGFYKYSSPRAIDTTVYFEYLEVCVGEIFNEIHVITQDTIIETAIEGIASYDIYVTEITMIPNVTETVQTILCKGSTVSYNGLEFDSPGLYFIDWFQTVEHGCDSIVYLDIQEVEMYVNNNTIEIEEGEQFDGIEIYQDTVITQVFIDQNGCDSLEIYDISVSEVLSSSQDILSNQYTLSPNPTSDILRIASLGSDQIISIDVTDLNGKKFNITPNILSSNIELDLSALAKGVYFITVQDESGKFTEKIIKL